METQNYERMMKLQQNLQAIEKYLVEIQQQSESMQLVKEAMDEFAQTKKETEILVPLVNGIFFKAQLTENSKFVINVGEGVLTEMSISDSKEMLDKQINQMKENQILMTAEFNKLMQELNAQQQ